jgi:chemotaxis protein MotB
MANKPSLNFNLQYMRAFFFLLVITVVSSCVSSKKYKQLELSYHQMQNDLQQSNGRVVECTKNNLALEQKLLTAHNENQLKDQKMESMKKEDLLKDVTIKSMEDNLSFVKNTNAELSKRMDDLSLSNKVNVDIMKKLLEEAEMQHLKVLNLSLALQKQDSLNIHLVKRSKKNISEQKVKKSLEKLGFVFY